MKKLSTETKKELVKKAKENDKYLAQALKFIGDFGKYKERKKYPLSDVEYKKSMKDIQSNILSVFHNFNVTLEIIKLHKLTEEHKEVLTEVNEIIMDEINAEIADKKNRAELPVYPKLMVEKEDDRTVN